MALSFVGGNTGTAAGSTTVGASVSLTGLTGGSNSSPSTGDIVIVTVALASTTQVAPTISTSGYTTLATLYSNDTYDSNLLVAYKVMGGTPDTKVDTGASGNAADALSVTVHVWRGGDTTYTLDVQPVTTTGINTGRPTPPAITPIASGSIVICCGGSAGSTTTAFTTTDLSNFQSIGSSDTNSAISGMGSYTWTSGTFTPAIWGGSGTTTTFSWTAVSISIRIAETLPSTPASANPITVASYNTGSSNTTSISITKPTGLASGDLLVCTLGAYNDASYVIDTPLGWTLARSSASGQLLLKTIYKRATSSDTGATSMTFTRTGNLQWYGILTRITGFDSTAIIDTTTVGSGTTQTINCSTITPNKANNLFLLGGVSQASGTPGTFTSYAAATDNPTWTEIQDTGITTSTYAGMAWAVRSATTATGNLSIQRSRNDGSDFLGHAIVIKTVQEINNSNFFQFF